MRSLAAACLFALLAWSPVARAQEALSPDEVRPLEVAGRFDEAAALLEQRAAAPGVAPALARVWFDRALDYRLALGDVALASRTLEALAAVAPAAHVATRALEIGDALSRGRRWRESADFHTAWLARHGRRADATLRARANVTLGNAWRELGDEARALAAYRAARPLTLPPPPPPRLPPYRGGASGVTSPLGGMSEPGEPLGTLDERVGAAWEAEAMFWQLDPRLRRLIARTRRPYRAPSAPRAHERWLATTMMPPFRSMASELWVLTENGYAAVVNEHALRWEIAAYERLAAGFFALGSLALRVSIPDEMPPYWRAMLAVRHDTLGEYAIDTVLVALQRCIDRSILHRETRSLSRCERALYDLDPRRFPLRDEVTPAPDQGVLAARDLPAVLHASDP